MFFNIAIGFDFFYRYYFRFAGKYKISNYFSLNHLEYLLKIFLFIFFFSFGVSSLVQIFKKVLIKK
jgi:hypothetical protein